MHLQNLKGTGFVMWGGCFFQVGDVSEARYMSRLNIMKFGKLSHSCNPWHLHAVDFFFFSLQIQNAVLLLFPVPGFIYKKQEGDHWPILYDRFEHHRLVAWY